MKFTLKRFVIKTFLIVCILNWNEKNKNNINNINDNMVISTHLSNLSFVDLKELSKTKQKNIFSFIIIVLLVYFV
jgi:hypothetical protein